MDQAFLDDLNARLRTLEAAALAARDGLHALERHQPMMLADLVTAIARLDALYPPTEPIEATLDETT